MKDQPFKQVNFFRLDPFLFVFQAQMRLNFGTWNSKSLRSDHFTRVRRFVEISRIQRFLSEML